MVQRCQTDTAFGWKQSFKSTDLLKWSCFKDYSWVCFKWGYIPIFTNEAQTKKKQKTKNQHRGGGKLDTLHGTMLLCCLCVGKINMSIVMKLGWFFFLITSIRTTWRKIKMCQQMRIPTLMVNKYLSQRQIKSRF